MKWLLWTLIFRLRELIDFIHSFNELWNWPPSRPSRPPFNELWNRLLHQEAEVAQLSRWEVVHTFPYLPGMGFGSSSLREKDHLPWAICRPASDALVGQGFRCLPRLLPPGLVLSFATSVALHWFVSASHLLSKGGLFPPFYWWRLKNFLMWTIFKVKVLVTQSCPILCEPVECSPPGSSVHGIF